MVAIGPEFQPQDVPHDDSEFLRDQINVDVVIVPDGEQEADTLKIPADLANRNSSMQRVRRLGVLPKLDSLVKSLYRSN